MSRKKKHAEHVNHERWLVSYADFITLLFATFTALYAISNADLEKWKSLKDSLGKAFNQDSGPEVLIETPKVFSEGGASPDGPLIISIFPGAQPPGQGTPNAEPGEESLDGPEAQTNSGTAVPLLAATPDAEADPLLAVAQVTPVPTPTPSDAGSEPNVLGMNESEGNEALVAEITEMLNDLGLKDKVEVREESRGTVISLGEAAFFDTGEIDVHPESRFQLTRIVNALRDKSFQLRVEGHTDDQPVTSGRYHSNWELSALRASRIVEFMIKEFGFEPGRLSSAGYGESRPIATNATPQGRDKNRRVDIVILNQQAAASEPPARML